MKTTSPKRCKKWLIVFLAIFLIIIVALLSAYFVFESKYQARFYPGIYLANVDLSGLSWQEAKDKINDKLNRINQEGFSFHYHNQDTQLPPILASIEGDLAIEMITFDIDNTLNIIHSYGRTGNFVSKLTQKFMAWKYKKNYPILFSINKKETLKFIASNFDHFNSPAEDAKLVYSQKYENSWYFEIESEKYGQSLDYNKAIEELKINVRYLNQKPIDIEAKIDYPELYKQDALNIESKSNKILNNAPISISADDYIWQIPKTELVEWLVLKPNTNIASASDDKIMIGLDYTKVKEYLDKTIAPEVNKEPIDAKFKVIDGKVTEFQVSKDGQEISIDKNYELLEDSLLNNKNEIALIIDDIKSDAKTEEINDLGVKEILGIGHSSFAGSPRNRRHNISTGAESVNGVLVAPDEEFSLLSVLGEINKESGYLPELVIKDNKTIPEYGGGLCQIGTTVFRATVESGLPVTLRRNHSYRVSYYEPAGTDATIYDPWPDYKFLNDTGNHILIQSRIDGDDLYFEFWGTNDGRVATHTYPVISKIVKPAPTKIIETLDLEPGEKKCTEHAHNGADAYFDYTVEYPDGEIKEETFYSHYSPWREVCLLGVEKLSSTDGSTDSTEIVEEADSSEEKTE